MKSNSSRGALFLCVFLGLAAAAPAHAEPFEKLLRVFVSNGSGDCDFIVDTPDGRTIKGIKFNCENAVGKSYKVAETQVAGGVPLKTVSLLIKKCDVVKLQVTHLDASNLVRGTLIYKTSCLSGNSADFDFEARWDSDHWVTYVNAAPAYCFNVNVVGPGVDSITPDSDPACASK